MTDTTPTPTPHPGLTLEGLVNDTHRVGGHLQQALDLDGFGSITAAYRATPVVALITSETDAEEFGVAGFKVQRVGYDEADRRAVVTLGAAYPIAGRTKREKRAFWRGYYLGSGIGVVVIPLITALIFGLS